MSSHRYTIFCFICIVFGLFLPSCKTPAPEKKSKEEIARQTNDLVRVNKYLVGKDADIIRGYVNRRGWKMTVSETGLWYMVLEKGKGPVTKAGKIAEIAYNVSLLDGTVCYSSANLGNKKFMIGKGGVESGLEEAILLLNEGGKGNFILPPHLAHGLMGDEKRIPPRSIILYEVEVVKISE